MENAELNLEIMHFKRVVEFVNEELKRIKRINPWETTFDKQVAESLSKMYAKRTYEYERARENPFFARIDFAPNGEKKGKYYIGRTSILDDKDIEEDELRVIDWRSPLASLYYSDDIGHVMYVAPDGVIEGELALKRQYKIKDGEFLGYSDVNIATNDELLQNALSDASDVRLKNIVTTIQAEQNRVIRKELGKNIIVQGVAGSGKTTVALHRVAYLLYAYQKLISAEKMLIVAPNKFFLNYISDTLPDLGVEDIVQKTYEDFVMDCVGGGYTVFSYSEKEYEPTLNRELLNFKCSLNFKDVISKYLEIVEKEIVDKITDFSYEGRCLVKAEVLREFFYKFRDKKTFSERIEIVKLQLTNYISKMLEDAEQGLNSVHIDYNSFKKVYKKLITAYIKSIGLGDVWKHYKSMICIEALFEGIMDKKKYEVLKTQTVDCLKKKRVYYEDLPALLFIHAKVFGFKGEDVPQYIAVDEAQDLGEFHVYVLKEAFNKANLMLLGDITQGIYSRGIDNWQSINESVFNGNAEIIDLVKSYRTSIEIMNEANVVASKIKDKLSIKLATPVLRHGEKVVYHGDASIADITGRISELIGAGRKNIAVITRNNDHAVKMYQELSHQMDDIHLILDDTTEFKTGISVLSSSLSKGLEFDSVLLLNADEYKEQLVEAKLLYVAMTRAMHTLDVYNSDNCIWLMK